MSLRRGVRVQLNGFRSHPELNGQHGILLSFDAHKQAWRLLTKDGKGCVVREENLQVLPSSLRSSPLQSCELSPRTDLTIPQECDGEDSLEAIRTTHFSAVDDSYQDPKFIKGNNADQSAIQPGSHVQLHELNNRADLNGRIGVALRFYAGRWDVVVDGQLTRVVSTNLKVADVATCLYDEVETEPSSASLQVGDYVRVKGLHLQPQFNGCKGRVVQLPGSDSRCRIVLEDGSCKNVKVEALEVLASISEEKRENRSMKKGAARRCGSRAPGWDPSKCCRSMFIWVEQQQADYSGRSVQDWLSDIDQGHGFLDPYALPLQERYGSVARIVDLYAVRSDKGLEVQSKFFEDNSVDKLGHQRLFERWFASLPLDAAGG
eukprot:gnl/MRDRNA2_/MRDRNA2_124383_c0_seq1.p1 gnl/MRDRNA2_/MRDRNA2_124383_c0~~gnl/MRDRNA2_/MRDRNA2_124383_c0_seq1.p1  ORF type:complete len:376 (-),score=73.30 gnl/MRDRNA2_/MRDRNA2_124383_c0_seq1:164-1291(-)